MISRMLLSIALTVALFAGVAHAERDGDHRVKHVLLISVDGMHHVDLANWIAHNPNSSLARLSGNAITFTAARTTTPSDSFPGLLSMVTGGTPKSTKCLRPRPRSAAAERGSTKPSRRSGRPWLRPRCRSG